MVAILCVNAKYASVELVRVRFQAKKNLEPWNADELWSFNCQGKQVGRLAMTENKRNC